MGRSQDNTYIPNPAKHNVQWGGADGFFFLYDSEKKERVELDLPLRFAWVESLAAITGYNEPEEFFIRSNEIKDIKTEELCVHHYVPDGEKFKKVVDFTGVYSDIKDHVKSKSYGGRYTTIVYAVADGDNGPIKSGDLIRIEIAGAALNAWIDKGFKHHDGGVAIYESVAKKKGRVEYFQPVFKQETIGPEVDAAACDADKLVNEWVTQKPSKKASNESPPSDDESHIDQYEDDMPF